MSLDIVLSCFVNRYDWTKLESYLNWLWVEFLGLALPLWVVMKIQQDIDHKKTYKGEIAEARQISMKIKKLMLKIKKKIWYVSIDILKATPWKSIELDISYPFNFKLMKNIIAISTNQWVLHHWKWRLKKRSYHSLFQSLDEVQKEMEYLYLRFKWETEFWKEYLQSLKRILDLVSDRSSLRNIENAFKVVTEAELIAFIEGNKKKAIWVWELYSYINSLLFFVQWDWLVSIIDKYDWR